MDDEWISAARALKLASEKMTEMVAKRAICGRAHDSLVKAKAISYVVSGKTETNFEIPSGFWSARGGNFFQGNWATGDMQTSYNKGQSYVRAYGVTFRKSDIYAMLGKIDMPDDQPKLATVVLKEAVGGRPPAPFWDDMWAEIARQLYDGDLKPERQSDIEKVMLNWAATHGYELGVTTARERARKLWQAINKEDGN